MTPAAGTSHRAEAEPGNLLFGSEPLASGAQVTRSQCRPTTDGLEPDYSAARDRGLSFGQESGVESLEPHYEWQSSGRSTVGGQVPDWVKVTYNEARYGRSSYPAAQDHQPGWLQPADLQRLPHLEPAAVLTEFVRRSSGMRRPATGSAGAGDNDDDADPAPSRDGTGPAARSWPFVHRIDSSQALRAADPPTGGCRGTLPAAQTPSASS